MGRTKQNNTAYSLEAVVVETARNRPEGIQILRPVNVNSPLLPDLNRASSSRCTKVEGPEQLPPTQNVVEPWLSAPSHPSV